MRNKVVSSALAGGLAVSLLAGCYGTTVPSYNPADASTLVQDITRRGITVMATVGGDSACVDASLTNNALHLTVADPGNGQARHVYIYTFSAKTWDASKVTLDACQQIYARANPAAQIVRLDIPIYRVLGADWSPQLRDLVTSAVTEASQAGEPPP